MEVVPPVSRIAERSVLNDNIVVETAALARTQVPYLSVEIDSKEHSALFDTGCSQSFMSRELWAEISLAEKNIVATYK